MEEDVTATEIAVAATKENEQRKILAIIKEKGKDELIKYLESQLDK